MWGEIHWIPFHFYSANNNWHCLKALHRTQSPLKASIKAMAARKHFLLTGRNPESAHTCHIYTQGYMQDLWWIEIERDIMNWRWAVFSNDSMMSVSIDQCPLASEISREVNISVIGCVCECDCVGLWLCVSAVLIFTIVICVHLSEDLVGALLRGRLVLRHLHDWWHHLVDRLKLSKDRAPFHFAHYSMDILL